MARHGGDRLDYVLVARALPPDVVLAVMDIVVGCILMSSPPLRTSSPAFIVAKALLPIRVWGVIYVALGVGILLALSHHNTRWWGWGARTFGAAVFVMWALMFGIAASNHGTVSWVLVPIYAYLAYRHTFVPLVVRRC